MTTFNEINLYATGHVGITYMQVDLDAYYDGAWHDIYEGTYGSQRKFTLAESKDIEKIRVRYYWHHVIGDPFNYTLLYEVYLTLNDTGKTLPFFHEDLGSSWTDEQLAYDDNLTTGAWVAIPSDTWSSVLEFYFVAEVITIKAYKNTSGVKMELTGNLIAEGILKRGFEYMIQDTEPAPEAEGTEITEESATPYETGEYTLDDYDAGRPLYDLEEDTIFWFRAIIYVGENKITGSWMKNVPTVTTDGAATTVFALTLDGNLTNLGANKVTKRGMRIVKNFVGSIHDTLQYRMKGFIVYSQEHRSKYSEEGVLIGFEWVIVFERYAYTESTGGFATGIYDITVGETLMTGLIPGDNYDVYAFAENNLGKGFGSSLNVTMGKIMSEGEPTNSSTTAEKTITISNLPAGCKVVRAGIRYGRTPSCNEGYVEKVGEWYNGESIDFLITGLIPDTKYYEEPYTIIEDEEGNQEEVTQPEEEWPEIDTLEDPDFPEITYPVMDDQGIDYELVVVEIKCNKIADQSIIDMFGRRRSAVINNHLIQDTNTCEAVRDDYINTFQILKKKVVLDYDIPLPFERADCILLGDGKHNYKDDGEGTIGAKADGEGIIKGQKSLMAKIRKIDIRQESGVGALLTIELEV